MSRKDDPAPAGAFLLEILVTAFFIGTFVIFSASPGNIIPRGERVERPELATAR